MSEVLKENERPKGSLLEDYRRSDKKNEQGETMPDNQTLNGTRISFYLESHGFTPKNFNERFKVKTALDILELRSTQGETEMAKSIGGARDFLARQGLQDLLEMRDPAAFRSSLHKEMLTRKAVDQEAAVLKGYAAYQTVRQLAEKPLAIKQQVAEKKDSTKVEMGSGFREQIGSVLAGVKDNYKKMDAGQKTLLLGGLIGLGTWFLSSEDETVKKVRDTFWNGLKTAGLYGGGALVVNEVVRVFNGKSAFDAIGDYISPATGRTEFWREAYKTDEKKAEAIQSSLVYLGNQDFMILAEKYKTAHDSGKNKIEGLFIKDMAPEDIYSALDIFFMKYSYAKVVPKYRNFNPRPTWLEAVSWEMAENADITLNGDFSDRVTTQIESAAVRGWNWLMVGKGLGMMKSLYLKVNGKPGTDDEVKNWVKSQAKLENDVDKKRDLETFCDRKIGTTYTASYKRALNAKADDSKYQGVSTVTEGGYIYIVSKAPMFNPSDHEKAIADAITAARENALSYLKTHHPEKSKNSEMTTKMEAGARVREDSEYVMFLRMPV